MIFGFALKNLLPYYVFMVALRASLMVTFLVLKKILRMIGLVLTGFHIDFNQGEIQ